jgi:hypothetical protein
VDSSPSSAFAPMAAYKLDSRMLTSKSGAKVFAEAIGDPSKPSVVFCHGMSSHRYVLCTVLDSGESGMGCDGSMFDVIFDRPDIQASIYAVCVHSVLRKHEYSD